MAKRRKKGIQYFTQETEDFIVLYNETEDFDVKSRIYNDKIHYAFFKLTENIIHTFKFYYTEVDNIEDLQHEVITFLLSKIHLFDQSRGAKAFSYFGTIAKRYLILSNQKNYKKRVDTAPISELFRKREDIDIFNKKALYIYIREMVDVKTPKITKIANQLYDVFKTHYVFYLENGYTKF